MAATTGAARLASERRRPFVAPSDRSAPIADNAPRRRWQLWLIGGFVVSLTIPWMLAIGPVRMTPYRILLLLAVIPCLMIWLLGKAGRIRAADLLFLVFPVMATVSLAQVHGLSSALQSGGIIFIETAGAYFLARVCIRTAADFRIAVTLMSGVVIALFPFAIVEAVTGTKPLLRFFGSMFPTVEASLMEPRFGLRRVQGPFDHSILFGVACGSILAMTHLVTGREHAALRRWLSTALVGTTAFLSLSSAAITAIVAQSLLLTWNHVLRHNPYRWKIVFGIIAFAYLFVSVGSNQSVPSFYISRFSFDQHSAGFRLLIWEYGSASALAHPWFGTGFDEWDRPSWMPPSVDMFWLLNAVRFGIPSAIIMFLAFFSAFLAVGLRKGLDERLLAYRTAYMIALISIFMSGWTVHFWNATYVLLIFIAGSGMWLLDAPPKEQEPQSSLEGGGRHSRHLIRRRADLALARERPAATHISTERF